MYLNKNRIKLENQFNLCRDNLFFYSWLTIIEEILMLRIVDKQYLQTKADFLQRKKFIKTVVFIQRHVRSNFLVMIEKRRMSEKFNKLRTFFNKKFDNLNNNQEKYYSLECQGCFKTIYQFFFNFLYYQTSTTIVLSFTEKLFHEFF